MAAASKQRKKAESLFLAAENAEARKRNQNTALRTDADITDEAAGARRIELAAQSKARKAAEARALAIRNAEQRKRNAAANQRGGTDMDISDEPAGIRRAELAAQAKARREAQAAEIAARTEDLRKLKNMKAVEQRTDDDIDDEEAGKARIALAAASKERRLADARALRAANVEMRNRLKNMKARTENHKGRAASATPLRPAEAAALAAEEAAMRRKQIREQDEAEELDLLRKLLNRSSIVEKKEGGWNSSPHRPVPYGLRGMRPMHTMDPWSKDVITKRKQQELPPSSSYSTACLTRLDDGMNDSVAELSRRRAEEEVRMSSSSARPAWDSTPWFYVPPALRGLKPVTREPWGRDLEIFQSAGS